MGRCDLCTDDEVHGRSGHGHLPSLRQPDERPVPELRRRLHAVIRVHFVGAIDIIIDTAIGSSGAVGVRLSRTFA